MVWRHGLTALFGIVLTGLALAGPVAADEAFTVRITPDAERLTVSKPFALELDASGIDGAFRRIDVYRGETKLQSLQSPRVRLSTVRLPPGRHALAFVARNERWRDWRVDAPVTIADPKFAPPKALEDFSTYSVDRWNEDFLKRYGLNATPFEQNDPEWDGDTFAWNMGYMLRAHTVMAQLTGSSYYMDKAGLMAHLIMENTDAKRYARGEIDIVAEAYHKSPPALFKDRTRASPGWRRFSRGGFNNDVLVDGHALLHIMRYVDAVLSDRRFAAHTSFARSLLPRVQEIIAFHDSMWFDDKYPTVPGSYYYSNAKGGHWSSPRAFNHSAGMLAAALYYDKHQPTPLYRDRAQRLVAFWKNHIRVIGQSIVWDYDPYTPSRNGPAEDINHGDYDLEFLILAYERGIDGISEEDMRGLARTFKTLVYRGRGNVAHRVDGSGDDFEPWLIDNIAMSWLALDKYDPGVFPLVVRVFEKHKADPRWERSFYGWANIMQHHARRSQ